MQNTLGLLRIMCVYQLLILKIIQWYWDAPHFH